MTLQKNQLRYSEAMKPLSSATIVGSHASAKPDRLLSTQLPDIDFGRVGRVNQNDHGMINKMRSIHVPYSSERQDFSANATAISGGLIQAQ